MNRNRRILLIVFVALASLGCDQATKEMAARQLPQDRPVIVVSQVLQLQYAENPGGMMGMGSNLSDHARFWLFEVLTAMALCAILAFTVLERSLGRIDIFALGLLLGGGLGNLLDRLLKDGNVVDFMIITLGPLKTAVFNVADLTIIASLMLLGLARLFRLRKPVRQHEPVETDRES